MTATTHLVAALAVTAAAIATAFALPVPAQAMTITIAGDGDRIVGSGHVTDTQRKLAPFTTLRIEGPVDVDAHPGANPGVTIHADDNIEPLIETVVEGNDLVVRLRHGTSFRTSHNMKVDIEFSALTATTQHGSGDLHIHSINSPKLDSRIAGSGDLQVDGAQLGSFSLSIAGSGDAKIDGRA
ncbi:MAG TPA: DUF2807 domain-containing protein, partial [Burkholderiaceae bacterium]